MDAAGSIYPRIGSRLWRASGSTVLLGGNLGVLTGSRTHLSIVHRAFQDGPLRLQLLHHHLDLLIRLQWGLDGLCGCLISLDVLNEDLQQHGHDLNQAAVDGIGANTRYGTWARPCNTWKPDGFRLVQRLCKVSFLMVTK